MSDIGVYTPETAKLVLEVVRYLKANGFVIEPGGRKPQFVPPDAPVYIRNDSGLVVPPFACCQVTGTVDVGGQNYLTIDQPADVTGEGGWYVFNGIAEIEAEADSYGIAYDGPLVRMLTDGSTITAGDRWQPMVNAWTVEPGGSLFIAAGADDIEADVMRAFIASVGGSGQTIEFIIQSVAPATEPEFAPLNKASVLVKGGPAELVGTVVDVIDHSGCIFDIESMNGYTGWAHWAQYETMDTEEPCDTLTEPHWAAINRCCEPNQGTYRECEEPPP
jgi:hypothetical protein